MYSSLYPTLLAITLLTAGSPAVRANCPDAAEVLRHQEFAQSTFKHLGQATIAGVRIEESSPGSGIYKAISKRTGNPLATVVGLLSGKKLSVTSMRAEEPTRGDRYYPGLPFRILRHLRETGVVETLRVQVNTEVYEELRSIGTFTTEEFLAHWAGFDYASTETIPLYNIEDSGHQTWLVYKPTPPEDPNEVLKPGSGRPMNPPPRRTAP